MTYAEKLKHPKWQKKRLQILKRDKFTCQLCKDTETTLHIHHLKYTAKNIWDEPNENLKTLCEVCHEYAEIQKRFPERSLLNVVKDERREVVVAILDDRLIFQNRVKNNSIVITYNAFNKIIKKYNG